MSTTAPEQTTTDVTTFRGRTLEELLPQIREQLGSDAVVVRQRDGLMGGIGGFFQQRFVEVDAKAGGPGIDVYDEEPEPIAPEPDTFAALLAAAETADEGGPRITVAPTDHKSHSSPEPAPLDAQAAVAPTLTDELTKRGMSHAFAERLIAEAAAHELPFADGDLRAAVRRALARRLPNALPHRAAGLAVAFAGPDSTACATALAAAYKRAGRDARAVASLDRALARVERADADAVLALDLPPIPSDPAEAAALAQRLATVELDDVVAVLPAELDLPSLRALLDRMQPFAPTSVAIAHAGAADLGAALELSCSTRLPIAYVHDGAAIAPADAARLAERLLP